MALSCPNLALSSLVYLTTLLYFLQTLIPLGNWLIWEPYLDLNFLWAGAIEFEVKLIWKLLPLADAVTLEKTFFGIKTTPTFFINFFDYGRINWRNKKVLRLIFVRCRWLRCQVQAWRHRLKAMTSSISDENYSLESDYNIRDFNFITKINLFRTTPPPMSEKEPKIFH